MAQPRTNNNGNDMVYADYDFVFALNVPAALSLYW